MMVQYKFANFGHDMRSEAIIRQLEVIAELECKKVIISIHKPLTINF